MRVAAIDLGSNSIRLLVAEFAAEPGGETRVVTVARAGETCRLARDLERTGRIDDALADRCADLAADFAGRARALHAQRIVAGATAALRNASNGREVADRVGERAGVPVRILSGEDEARLVYQAVVGGLGGRARKSPCVVFDVGGGSTEVVSGLGEQAGRWTSLPFGAVSLTERFLAGDPPSVSELAGARDHVRAAISEQASALPSRTPLLAGVGGTVTVLALLDRALPAYDPNLLQGWSISGERLDVLVERLAASTESERRLWPAMGEGRADIVVGGALIVGALVERFPSGGLVCSTHGLRYALARLAAEEASGNGLRAQDPR